MKTKTLIVKVALVGLVAGTLLMPFGVRAAGQLTSRSATVSSSAGAATGVSYTVGFTLSASQTLGSVKFEICDSPLSTVSCVGTGNSSGASFGSATFGSMSLGSGWSIGSQTGAGAGGTSLVLTHVAASLSGAAVAVINNVANPTSNNKEYYLRISTYTDTTATAPAYPGTDFGGIALGTAQQITVSGVMPESLIFCVGTSGTDCTNITGSTVDLGTFSPTATNFGTSLMSASTNAGSGYIITINGTTLTSGANTITAMGTQSLNSSGCAPSCTSTTGTSQFGSNVRDNATPNVGTNVSGLGTATGFGGYNTVDSFRFFTGDTVASVGGVTKSNLFTNSYIVNVGGDQAAGVYSATMTYICTATF
jgi:hypothetical protein